MTGESFPELAIKKLFRHNNCVVITLGSRGLLWMKGKRSGYLPAYRIPAIDTTGAGDVFHGAFAGCIASGSDWESVLNYSSAAAALSCTRMGARTGIPGKNEVDCFLERFDSKHSDT